MVKEPNAIVIKNSKNILIWQNFIYHPVEIARYFIFIMGLTATSFMLEG